MSIIVDLGNKAVFSGLTNALLGRELDNLACCLHGQGFISHSSGIDKVSRQDYSKVPAHKTALNT